MGNVGHTLGPRHGHSQCESGNKTMTLFGQQRLHVAVDHHQRASAKRRACSGLAILLALLLVLTGCGDPDADYDEAFDTDTIEAYTTVLQEHPTHRRAPMATAQLGELRWQSVRKSRDLNAVRGLIREYPTAAFVSRAAQLLDELSWEDSRRTSTSGAYSDYLTSFPDGKYAADAKSQIEELAWQDAIGTESSEKLNDFLTRYPQSSRTSEAKRRIRGLERQHLIQVFENDDIETLRTLDDGSLTKEVQEAFGWPPLLLAADKGATRIAAHLIDRGVDVNAKGEDAATAMHVAARAGSIDVAKLLVSNNAEIDAVIEKKQSYVKFGAAGSFTTHTPRPTAKKGTPLHWAAYYNQPQLAAFLLQNGANVNADDGYGNMPIHFAAQSGNLGLVKTLIEAGADWRSETEDSSSKPNATPLHYAKTVDVAKYFMDQGIAVDMDSDLGQPIHAASHLGHVQVVAYLLEQGAAVSATCDWEVGALKTVHATPVWIAARAGHIDVINLLVDKGGNIHDKADRGGGLVHAAAMSGRVDMIMYLIEKEVPIDEDAPFPYGHPLFRNWEKITPLGVAVHYGQFEAVRTLVEAGADVNATFSGGWNPLAMAVDRKMETIASYLRQHGAKQE